LWRQAFSTDGADFLARCAAQLTAVVADQSRLPLGFALDANRSTGVQQPLANTSRSAVSPLTISRPLPG
jgi:hypothetical protein